MTIVCMFVCGFFFSFLYACILCECLVRQWRRRLHYDACARALSLFFSLRLARAFRHCLMAAAAATTRTAFYRLRTTSFVYCRRPARPVAFSLPCPKLALFSPRAFLRCFFFLLFRFFPPPHLVCFLASVVFYAF